MSEIEDRLRAAMHAAVDSEQIPSHLVGLVVRRQRRRRVLAVGFAALVALALAVPAALALRGALASSPPSTHHHGTSLPKRFPTELTGQPWPAGTNLRILLLTSKGAALFSTATGGAQPISGLPPALYFFNRVVGGWTADDHVGGGGCPVTCDEPQYFVADGSLSAKRIGSGYPTQASDRPGEVWLDIYPPDTPDIQTTPAYAQLVTTAGRTLGPQYRMPAGYLIDRGVGRYLLLELDAPTSPRVYELWDPRTHNVIRRLDNVAGAGPDQIAFSPDCRHCRMQILTVSTGKTVTTSIPGGQPSGLSGTFTDDGRLLTVLLPSGAIGVYDTQRQDLTVIPGTILANDVVMTFGWLDGSHRLVIEATRANGNSGRTQIAYWQPGDSRLRVATFSIPGGASAVVAAGSN